MGLVAKTLMITFRGGGESKQKVTIITCWKNFEPFPKCKNTYSEKISLQKQQIVFTKL